QMVTILGCVPGDGVTAVEAACQEALDQGVCSAAVILNILARHRDPAPAAHLQIPDALRLTHEPIADCARYDSLEVRQADGTHTGSGIDEHLEALRHAQRL
ncbi:IS21 family transposase, partial [Rhizobium sp. CSW-27]|nr:IS21 family transposase [Rhizobium sp. CSW-27]